METIKLKDGNFLIHGYTTEKDEKKAKKDIERFAMNLAEMSLTDIVRFLEPYRRKMAKLFDNEK